MFRCRLEVCFICSYNPVVLLLAVTVVAVTRGGRIDGRASTPGHSVHRVTDTRTQDSLVQERRARVKLRGHQETVNRTSWCRGQEVYWTRQRLDRRKDWAKDRRTPERSILFTEERRQLIKSTYKDICSKSC